MSDTDTGELVEKTLEHEGGELRKFYSALAGLSPLEQQAIPHPAISDTTHKLIGVEVMWEAEFNPTCFVKGPQVFRGKLKIETGEIVLQLRELLRSDNRYDWYRPIT
jgi:hypothetical protein